MIFAMYYSKAGSFFKKRKNPFRFFLEHGFDGIAPTLLSPNLNEAKYFFLFESLSLGLADHVALSSK